MRYNRKHQNTTRCAILADFPPHGVTEDDPQAIHEGHLLHQDLRDPLTLPGDGLLCGQPEFPPGHYVIAVPVHVLLGHVEMHVSHLLDPGIERLSGVVVHTITGEVPVPVAALAVQSKGPGSPCLT